MEGTLIVTGASGFIGRALCEELLDRDCTVIGITRSNSPPPLGIDWRRADITNLDEAMDALEDADYLFHLAGIGLMDGTPEEVRTVNIEGTSNVVEAVQNGGCKRLVFTSTAGTRHRPGKELATEGDIADPIGAYQESKLRAEQIVQDYVEDGGDAVITHPTSVFGPGDPRMTPKMIGLVDSKIPAYLPGGGSVVSVNDVVSGLIAAAERGESGEHYILGGENLTFEATLTTIGKEMDASAPSVPVPPFVIHTAGYGIGIVNRILGTEFFPVNHDMAKLSTRYRFYTSEKAAEELGYSITPFSEHVTEAIEWYQTEK